MTDGFACHTPQTPNFFQTDDERNGDFSPIVRGKCRDPAVNGLVLPEPRDADLPRPPPAY